MKEEKQYYLNKQIKEQGFVDKKGKQGKWYFYKENGKLFKEVEYENNEEHGLFIRYHDSGVIAYTTHFNHGLQDGMGVEYYENEKKKEEWIYQDGQYKPINFWDEKGEQLMKEGTGKKIEVFGASGSEVVEQYFEKGEFIKEVKLTNVIYGSFNPMKPS